MKWVWRTCCNIIDVWSARPIAKIFGFGMLDWPVSSWKSTHIRKYNWILWDFAVWTRTYCNLKTFKHCFRRHYAFPECLKLKNLFWIIEICFFFFLFFSCSLLSFVFPVCEHISLPDRLAANLNNLWRNIAVMIKKRGVKI